MALGLVLGLAWPPECPHRPQSSGATESLSNALLPCRKLRWHSFQNSHRPSLNSASLEINRQSSAQLNLLQKCSLLRLTAIMEKYSVPHKQAWTW